MLIFGFWLWFFDFFFSFVCIDFLILDSFGFWLVYLLLYFFTFFKLIEVGKNFFLLSKGKLIRVFFKNNFVLEDRRIEGFYKYINRGVFY